MNVSKFALVILIFFSVKLESMAQVDSGYVKIKKGVLFYRIWGEGYPVVFLNGGPGLASNGYESYAKEISYNRKVILFDQRGTGKSKLEGGIQSITILQMVNDLEKLREHLKINKWDVFGHSFGGQYAINYLVKHTDKINKVILSATPGVGINFLEAFQSFNSPKPENLTETELEIYNLYTSEANKENPSPDKIRRLSLALRARYYVSKPENYAVVADWWINKCKPASHRRTYYTSETSKKAMIKKLKKISNPVLIIHGINDFVNISNPLSNHEIFQNSQLEIIYDSGHMMSIDSKEEYFGKINKFLNQ